MTQSHLIVKEEGICIYHKPVHFYSDSPHEADSKMYQADLKQAQSSANLCEDQVKALSLIQKFHHTDHVEIGSIYPVPGIEFEEVRIPIPCPDNIEGCEVYHTKTVARLIEHTAEKEGKAIGKMVWDKEKEDFKIVKSESPEIDKEENQQYFILDSEDALRGMIKYRSERGEHVAVGGRSEYALAWRQCYEWVDKTYKLTRKP